MGGAIPAAPQPGTPMDQGTPETPSGAAEPGAAAPEQQPEASEQTAAAPAVPGPQISLGGHISGYIPLARAGAAHRVCPRPSHPNEAACDAIARVDVGGAAPDGGPAYGFGAPELQRAYEAPSATRGKGQIVAIVDAYGYPNASKDLAVYRKYYHLPECTTANGCLRTFNEHGGTSLPGPNPGWESEQALDLDMVSAMCPNCKILLIQASSDYFNDLYAANTTAANLGADVVSNSYGGSESESTDSRFPAGHTYVASAGDNGGGAKDQGGPAQPCSLANFVCVGGTALNGSGRTRSEVVWNDLKVDYCGATGTSPCGASGSGCSARVAKPAWQTTGACGRRAEADIAAVGAVSTPVATYQPGYGWQAYGGTSASAPLIAGMIALAGNGKSVNVAQRIWRSAGKPSLHDVVKGTNVFLPVTGPCVSPLLYICVAGHGFSGPTGWGSPNGVTAL